MPLILIIVGILVALGFGRFLFMNGPTDSAVTIVTPVTRPTDATTSPTDITDTPTDVSSTSVTDTKQATTTPVPSTPTPTPTPVTTPKPIPSPAPVVKPVTTYKDGVYSVTTSYTAPGRSTHTVTTAVTLANDIVTKTTVAFSGDNVETSSEYQNRFAAKYQTQVVGKALNSVALSRVGGASLTTNAYNKALAEVKSSARS